MKSFNKLILEPYKAEALKSEIKHGIAMVSQKNRVIGLKLLVDAQIPSFGEMKLDGISIPYTISKGSTIYIREEVLHNQAWAKNSLKSSAVEGDFIIVDMGHMEFAEDPK